MTLVLRVPIPGYADWTVLLARPERGARSSLVLTLLAEQRTTGLRASVISTWSSGSWSRADTLLSHAGLAECLEDAGTAPSLAQAVASLVGDPAAMLLQLEVMTS